MWNSGCASRHRRAGPASRAPPPPDLYEKTIAIETFQAMKFTTQNLFYYQKERIRVANFIAKKNPFSYKSWDVEIEGWGFERYAESKYLHGEALGRGKRKVTKIWGFESGGYLKADLSERSQRGTRRRSSNIASETLHPRSQTPNPRLPNIKKDKSRV